MEMSFILQKEEHVWGKYAEQKEEKGAIQAFNRQRQGYLNNIF